MNWQDRKYRFRIPFADDASFENCMNAVCVLLLKGKSPEYVAEKVEALQPIAMRMEIKDGINHCVLINDYYNSDAASFQLALNTLSMQDAGREKVVILSDFVGSGNEEEELYREVARLLREAGVSLFIGIGDVISRYKSYFLIPHCRFYEDTDSFLRQENREPLKRLPILRYRPNSRRMSSTASSRSQPKNSISRSTSRPFSHTRSTFL